MTLSETKTKTEKLHGFEEWVENLSTDIHCNLLNPEGGLGLENTHHLISGM